MTTPREVQLAQLQALEAESSRFRSTMDGLVSTIDEHLNKSGQRAATASELRAVVTRLETEKAELEELNNKLTQAVERLREDREYALGVVDKLNADITAKDNEIKRLTEAQKPAQTESAAKSQKAKE